VLLNVCLSKFGNEEVGSSILPSGTSYFNELSYTDPYLKSHVTAM